MANPLPERPKHSDAAAPDDLRIFLDELPWDLRSHNTDWRYARFALPQLARFEPSLHLIQQRSRWLTLRENARILQIALGRRLHHPPSRHSQLTSTLSARELIQSQADVVFAHRAFPLNAGGVPVVWQQAILDPAMQRSYGVTEAELAEETEVKGRLFRLATAVQVSTEAEAQRHAALFPDIAARFVPVPFFAPHLAACPPEALERHRNPNPVRILFVGGQAWRKGLDFLLEAFTNLLPTVQARARLTVISSFERSNIRVPQNERITILPHVTAARVLEEMRQSHIFVNLARFESYGLVFLEAMSQGLACIAPDWEVQRELFANGEAGLNLPCNAAALQPALERLILDEAFRHQLATAAHTRFLEKYAPAVVAAQYAALFRFALENKDSFYTASS